MSQPTLWLEGMFIEPQHFQQMERHLKTQLQVPISVLMENGYGLLTLSWQESLLVTQKLSLAEVSAVFQDGYLIDTRSGDLLPDPIDIPRTSKNQWVYLGLPMLSATKNNVTATEKSKGTRFVQDIQKTVDLTSAELRFSEITVGKAKPVLLLQPNPHYFCLKIAKIVEVDQAGKVILSSKELPTWLNINNSLEIQAFYRELLTLLKYRLAMLREVMQDERAYHVQVLSDLMMLNCLSRFYTSVWHIQQRKTLHPEVLYTLLTAFYTELTITKEGDLNLPLYQHEEQTLFLSLMEGIRAELTQAKLDKLVALPLKPYDMNCLQAIVQDQNLLKAGRLIIAIHGPYSIEALREKAALLKLSTPERIRDLIHLQLPGIKLQPLVHTPNPIPYYREYLYFEALLEAAGEHPVNHASSLVIHVPPLLNDLKIQMWVVRKTGES